jgi:hypothetical protein
LRKELHDDSPSLIPHPKKSKRISLKVKERVTHELKKKKKKTPRGTCRHTGTSWFPLGLQEGPVGCY